MEWATKIADWSVPALITGGIALAKWVHNISMAVEEHGKQIERGVLDHEECDRRSVETAVRLAETDQRQEHLHETLAEVKSDVKDILRHLRGRNGV